MGIFSINKKKYATLKIEKKKVEKKVESKKVEPNITGSGLWVKCPGCNEIIYKRDIKKNEMKCPNCDSYFKMSGKQRIELLIDKDTFEEFDVDLSTKDPLKFPDYAKKIESAKIKTKLKEGVISGVGKMFGMEVSIAAMDFSFLGGMLKMSFFIIIGIIISSFLFGFSLGLFFSAIMVIIASASILYQTSNILRKYNTNQHVAASLALFSAVALLYWYILQILMSRD